MCIRDSPSRASALLGGATAVPSSSSAHGGVASARGRRVEAPGEVTSAKSWPLWGLRCGGRKGRAP
eukprot:2577709-Pyramimonas_sp.AAC.1